MACSKGVYALLSVFFAAPAAAQVDLFPKPWGKPELWSAETLWVGASFTRTSSDPVTVSLKGNGAGWPGDLLFIDPKTGAEDRLFSNHDPVGTTVILSNRHDIPLGDTLYFVYRVTEPAKGDYPSAASVLPKYTGPNLAGRSRYVSTATNPKYGHRWSVAGRVNDSLVEFGFEDNVEPTNSDYDFDDIVFRTTLSLINDEVPAKLAFTDKAGTPLADGAFYSPGNDTLYLRYSDDFATGTLRMEAEVRIRNRRGAAAPDSERTLLAPLRREGSSGVWTAKLPIDEAGGVPGDGKAQVYYLGEVYAGVKSHNRFGQADGGTASATLNVAYPDQPEAVKAAACPDASAPIDRITSCITIRVADQSFTRKADTVRVQVKCGASGDVLARVPLFEQPGGGYLSGGIAKNEGPADPADTVLSCKATDEIVVTYADEVYGKQATDRAAWSGAAPEALFFAKAADPVAPLDSAQDGQDGNAFRIVAKGPSPTVGVRDTLLITVTTDQGDRETFAAVETEANSNVYIVPSSFRFSGQPPASGNGRLDGYLDPYREKAVVTATAAALIDGKPFSAVLILHASRTLIPGRVETAQGYPPVAGLDPDRPGFSVGNGVGKTWGAFTPKGGSDWVIGWIPPADWPAGYAPGTTVYSPEKHAPGDPVKPGQDPWTRDLRMPPDIGAVQVISTGEYVAEVNIYDHLGNWVTAFPQSFGYRGELSNEIRKAKDGKGLVSFLAWNLKDSKGRRAGNGVYIWKILFRFRDGGNQVKYVRTGLTRGILR